MFSRQTMPVLLLGACATLAACVPNPPFGDNQTPGNTTQNLNNSGTLCLVGVADDDIKVYYLPIGTSCASSSLNRWNNSRLTAVLAPQGGREETILIDSFTTHIRSNSPVATADCAGAGIQTAQLDLSGTRGFEVFWGGRWIGGIANAPGAIRCNKVDASGNITPAPELHEEIRSMVQMDAFMGR